jgi:hypothetical protein
MARKGGRGGQGPKVYISADIRNAKTDQIIQLEATTGAKRAPYCNEG